MKSIFFPVLIASLLTIVPVFAQDSESGPTISVSGDSNTEQAAKLELIRILQERADKMTVAGMNSRIIVSQGVTNYYKVDEIKGMFKNMWNFRSRFVAQAQKLEASTSGDFTGSYINEYNKAMGQASVINKQLETVTTSGSPIKLPAMPSFSISGSTSDPVADFKNSMDQILAANGVHSAEDLAALPQDQQDKIKSQIQSANQDMINALKSGFSATTQSSLKLVGSVVGSLFGLSGVGSMLGGIFGGSGLAKAVAGLVGSITDKFQIPIDYYDSTTLKLTDAERLKMIDELHVRMSELYQQTVALGTNMNSETKKRFNEVSQPRNEQILYGPKK